jgi:hypothetical protein
MSEENSVTEYFERERQGMRYLSPRVIECFRPYHFSDVGYPFSINYIEEIWKYTECMHDGFGVQGPLDNFLSDNYLKGGFTEEEFSSLKTIISAVDKISKLIGRQCQYPANTLYYAINQARHIVKIAPQGSLIVELGGGSGYLGALLVQMGYRYVASDISQAFYLLQTKILEQTAPAGVIDYVYDDNFESLSSLKPGQAALIPWWKWANPEVPRCLSIDLVTSNHNLLEMHPFCLLYHLTVTSENLSDNALGFLFEGWGDPNRNPQWTAVKALSDKGFALAYHDKRITSFVAKDKIARPFEALEFPLKTVAATAPSQNPPHFIFSAKRRGIFGKLRGSLQKRLFSGVSISHGHSGAIGGPNLAYEFGDVTQLDNPIAGAIREMRRDEQAKIVKTTDDYKALLGKPDLYTRDEEFLSYIFDGTEAARPWVNTKF